MTARKPETTFYTAVNKLLPANVYSEKMNNPYRGGTPDVYYSGNRSELWVEYKWLPKQPKGLFRPDLSALQRQWLLGRHREGRNVAVITGCPTGVVIQRDLEWEQDATFGPILTRREAALWIVKETTHVTAPSGDSR